MGQQAAVKQSKGETKEYKSSPAARARALKYYYDHREEILDKSRKPEVAKVKQSNSKIWRERNRQWLRDYQQKWSQDKKKRP